MHLTKRAKIIIAGGVIVAFIAVGSPILAISVLNNLPDNPNSIRLTLLSNAGVLIASNGIRIYIDPIDLPESYSQYPADAILITHDHADHYQSSVIDMLQKEGTVNVFPQIMASAISLFEGIGVDPRDQIQVEHISITAFYMYTFSEYGVPASHPRESNYTSYIIDINGFTIFHAGDSKNLTEYDELTGLIDVALLPLGPGCQTMTGLEVVDAIHTIEPQYFIPIHYEEGAPATFITDFGSLITECVILNLAYFQLHVFW